MIPVELQAVDAAANRVRQAVDALARAWQAAPDAYIAAELAELEQAADILISTVRNLYAPAIPNYEIPF